MRTKIRHVEGFSKVSAKIIDIQVRLGNVTVMPSCKIYSWLDMRQRNSAYGSLFTATSLSINEWMNSWLCVRMHIFIILAKEPPVGQGLLIHEVSRPHTTTHSRQDSSGRVISPKQRPLRDKTQHSQQTDTHAAGGIRTHNPSKQAAADTRPRPRGHWDRHVCIYEYIFISMYMCVCTYV
jgi:hypothetical protein